MSNTGRNNQRLDNFANIPIELKQFLQQDTYSLLIKGHAGTGKTTLALTILREQDVNTNCLYISTRISPEKLFQYYWWLENFFNKPKKTDLTEVSETESDSSVFVDARLDEPGPLFERITNELMDIKAPTIIIDSWDAVGFLMDKEALMNNLRVLQTWRERSGARIIFVTESPEDKTLDFLADGVVELSQKYYDDKKVREIFFSKLRGVRINHHSYIFSLNNAIFRSYDRYDAKQFLFYENFTPLNKTTNKHGLTRNSHIPTGYHELDDLLGGGFPMNGIVSIELDTHINTKVAMTFLGKIVSNFIANKNPVLFQPFKGVSAAYISQHFGLSSSSQSGLVKVFVPVNKSKKASHYLSSHGEDENKKQIEIYQNTISALKRKYPKKLLLNVLGADIAEGFQKNESRKGLEYFISFIKSHSAISIFVVRSSQSNLRNYLSEISDVHLRILEINGTLFLQSQIPRSHLYAIVPETNSQYSGIAFHPIV